MTSDAQVLIAGGGLAGSALALALAQAGFTVVLADSLATETRAEEEFDGRAYAVAAACARMLGVLGVWPRLAGAAEPMRDIVVSDGRPGAPPAPFTLHFDHREGPGPFAFMVEDRHLRRALLAAVAEEPRITHLSPVTVTGEATGPARLTARLSDGGEVRAALMVACDGRGSAIARRAGIGFQGHAYGQTGLVSALEHDIPHQGVAHELFLPAGPFAVLPLTGNRVSLVWTERPERAAEIMALPDAGYHAELRRRLGDFLGPTRLAGRRWSYPLSLSLAETWVRPRLALLGDAAHGIHPLAGQGLNLSLKDVAALAEVLAGARTRGEDIGAVDVLMRYQRWRRFDAVALALACDGLNRLFSNDNPLLRPLRDAGLALVGRIGPARRFFIAEAAGTTGTLPRLLRGQAL